MKRFLLPLILLLSLAASAQSTIAELNTQANVIRNETERKANTVIRIGDMYLSIIASVPNVLTIYDDPTWINSLAWSKVTGKPTTLSGYGITDAQSALVSGTSIKTVNSTSLLGSGDVTVQPLDSDLTSIAGLSPTNDDIIQRKAGVWTNRTIAQLKTDAAISNVDNTSDANKPISTATQSALDAKQASLVSGTNIKTLESVSLLGSGNIDLAKGDVGLGNVDNTSDASKPVSTAQQTALNLKANIASPTLTGTPAAPTATLGTNTTQLATTQYVQTELAAIPGSSVATLAEAQTGTNNTKTMTPLRVSSVNQIVYNAKAYGAVGDGVSDDTTPIINTIAAIPTDGGILYLPAGDYLVTAQIIVNKNIIIQGAGSSQFNFYTVTTGVTNTSGTTNIHCSSTTIDNFLLTTTGTNTHPVIQVKDLSVYNTNAATVSAGSAFRLDGGIQRVLFDNVHIDGFYVDIDVVSASFNTFLNCVLSDPKTYALNLRNTLSPDVGGQVIDNCIFIGSRTDGRNPSAAINIKSGGSIVITNSHFNSGLNYTPPPNATTISQSFVYCIYLDILDAVTTSELKISNCEFDNYKESAINLNNNNVNPFYNVNISNIQCNPYSNLSSLREAVVMKNVRNVVIDNVVAYNQFSVAYNVVKLTSCQNVKIGKSIILDGYTAAANGDLYTSGGGNSNIVGGNAFTTLSFTDGVATTGLRIGSASPAFALSEKLLIREDQNAGTSEYIINATSGTSASAGLQLGTTSNLSSQMGLFALSAGYTTAGMLVANTGVSLSSMSGGLNIGTTGSTQTSFWTNNTERARFISGGQFGIGVTVPTAMLHLKAGTTAASTAPLKFTSGSLLTSAEAGAFEFLTDIPYVTITTGTARKEFTLNDASLTSGTVPVATTNGRLTNSGLSTTASTLYGSTAANGDIQVEGTSSATRATSYVNLQPTAGQVNIGIATPTSAHALLNIESSNIDGGAGTTPTPIVVVRNNSATLGSGANYNISVLSMNAGNAAVTAQLAANYGASANDPFKVRGGILATRTSSDGWLFYNNSVLSGIIGETGYATPYKEATAFGSQITLGTGTAPSTFGGYPTIFGYQAQGPGAAFGYKAQATNFEAIAFGPQSRASGLSTAALGDAARALPSGPNGNEWVMGDVAWATGNIDYIWGGGMGTARDFVLAIGQGSTVDYSLDVATADHQGFLGYYQENSSYFSGGAGLWNDWYIGGPVVASAPHAITWNVTSGLGSNIAGVDYTFNASRATGNATSGSWIFKTADVGSSGSTLQTLTTKLSITPAGVLIKGTATNDAAAAGNVGEEINSTVSTYTNFTTTATYQAITSITLTAGDWDISAFATYSSNSSTITAASNAIFVISTTTASASGATEGQNIMYVPQAALLGTSKFTDTITPYRVSISGSTTYYLNAQATFTVGNPQFVGSIRARRMR